MIIRATEITTPDQVDGLKRFTETPLSGWMLEAVLEGRLASRISFPNPPVGAVLVSGGEIVSRGHTQRPGEDHAEIDCLRKLDSQDSLPDNAVLYVTLEPCCFFGRTPPCTNAIIERGYVAWWWESETQIPGLREEVSVF